MVLMCNRIREERERLGLTQSQLGVASKTQRLYENGERSPDADYLFNFSALGADVLYIITGRREVTADVIRQAILSACELLSLPVDAPTLAQLAVKLCALPQTTTQSAGGSTKYVIAHNLGQVGDNMTNNFLGDEFCSLEAVRQKAFKEATGIECGQQERHELDKLMQIYGRSAISAARRANSIRWNQKTRSFAAVFPPGEK